MKFLEEYLGTLPAPKVCFYDKLKGPLTWQIIMKTLPYDVGPARAFLGEAEKTPWQTVANHTMCGLGPASRVNKTKLF